MEKKVKKLALHRETVKSLHDETLRTAAGAATNPECSFTQPCSNCCTRTAICSTCCP